MKSKPRKGPRRVNHDRCPVCGKLSRPGNFDAARAHNLESMIQICLGRGQGGFRWESEDRSQDVDWLRRMLRIVRDVHRRLHARLRELGESPAPLEDKEKLLREIRAIVRPPIIERVPAMVKPPIIERVPVFRKKGRTP